ncbi:MAG: methylcobamide--CoM methyltransferase [Chloroflexi bacterium]|nr:methylcobamide--CoM methyltransferase [Chloroflexota bacterium]
MSALPLLTREEVRAAVRFGEPPRPPRANALWHNADTLAAHGDAFRQLLKAYPDDAALAGMSISYWDAPPDDPTYRFAFGGKVKPEGLPIDACPVIAGWAELDQFLAEFPAGERPAAVHGIRAARQAYPDRYVLAGWGHYFHQRLAYLRGIEQLLFDFCDARDELRVVMDRLLELYRVWAARAAAAGADGVWGGDDLGWQRGSFMSPAVFREIYVPYYRALAGTLHANGLDFWLHSCGNVTELLDDLLDCGVDALHPIQAGTMDDPAIAARYGGRIAFWIGMDVQQVIPFGTPDEVRAAVRERIRTFYRPEGGLILAAGNAILPDTPLANLHAYLETICEG